MDIKVANIRVVAADDDLGFMFYIVSNTRVASEETRNQENRPHRLVQRPKPHEPQKGIRPEVKAGLFSFRFQESEQCQQGLA